jgi:hypothetical protein
MNHADTWCEGVDWGEIHQNGIHGGPFEHGNATSCLSQWARGLRRWSTTAARLL